MYELVYLDFICTFLRKLFLGMRIIFGSKKQTEPTRKYRFSSGPEKITYWVFFGPAGLCLSLDPTLDPIINMLCLLGIFGYFEYVSGIMDIF